MLHRGLGRYTIGCLGPLFLPTGLRDLGHHLCGEIQGMPEMERHKDNTEPEETKTEGYESRKEQERRNVNMHSSQTKVQ